jgi:hypothetical protein
MCIHVIERMLMAVENETLQSNHIYLLRLMTQQACKLCLKRNHRVLNYDSLDFGSVLCSDYLKENLEEVPVTENLRRSLGVVQFQTFSNTGFKPHFYRMKSYKVTCHLKKKIG